MSDLISRAAAIDAVISLCDDCDSGYCGSCRVNYPGEKDARKALEDLPSAQPEVLAHGEGELSAQTGIILCKDCKHRPTATEAEKGIYWGFSVEFPDELCPLQCEDGWYNGYPGDEFYCGNAERRKE